MGAEREAAGRSRSGATYKRADSCWQAFIPLPAIFAPRRPIFVQCPWPGLQRARSISRSRTCAGRPNDRARGTGQLRPLAARHGERVTERLAAGAESDALHPRAIARLNREGEYGRRRRAETSSDPVLRQHKNRSGLPAPNGPAFSSSATRAGVGAGRRQRRPPQGRLRRDLAQPVSANDSSRNERKGSSGLALW